MTTTSSTATVQLITSETRPAVRLERILQDPLAEVWAAITDRERLRTWFPTDVSVDGGIWKVGASITFTFGEHMDGMVMQGEVLEVEEPRLLAFTWGEDRLRFELEPSGSGTRLVLTDSLPASWAARNAAGWEACIDALAGTPSPEGAWKERFARNTAEWQSVLGEQEGPPAEYHGDELN